jgi:hypothetical protein
MDQLFKSNLFFPFFFPFSFLFLPLDLPICTLSVATFPFVLLFRFPFSSSMYLFIHLLFVPFLAGSSSLLLLQIFLQFLLFLIPYKLFPLYQYLPVSYFHPFPIIYLSSLATSLNFFCVFLSSFVKSSSIYILSSFLSFNLLLFSILFFFCSQLSIFASIILSLFILNASFTFTFTPISLSNHSSTPLYISSYSGYYNTYYFSFPAFLFVPSFPL